MSILSLRSSRSVLLAAAAVAVTGSVACADLFTFTYTDTNGVVATGNLNATDNGNGTMTCIAGDITFTAGPALGTYPLIPGSGLSPSGDFSVDNLLYPGDPTLTLGGILFGNTTDPIEINIWNTGGGVPYTLALWAPGGEFYHSDQTGTFTIAPSVPAPGAAAVLGLGLLASARRRRA